MSAARGYWLGGGFVLLSGIASGAADFDLTIDRVQTSCGSSVPEMKIVRHRAEDELIPFFDKMPDEKLVAYQKKKNMISIDGKANRHGWQVVMIDVAL